MPRGGNIHSLLGKIVSSLPCAGGIQGLGPVPANCDQARGLGITHVENILSFLSLSGYDSVLIGQRRGSEKNIISDTISEAKVGCSALRKVVASGKSTYEVHLLRVGLFRHTRT